MINPRTFEDNHNHNDHNPLQTSQPRPVTMEQVAEYSRTRIPPRGVQIPKITSATIGRVPVVQSMHRVYRNGKGFPASNSGIRSASRGQATLRTPPKLSNLSRQQWVYVKEQGKLDEVVFSRLYQLVYENLLSDGYLPDEKKLLDTAAIEKDFGTATYERQSAEQSTPIASGRQHSSSEQLDSERNHTESQPVTSSTLAPDADVDGEEQDKAAREIRRQDYKFWAMRYARAKAPALKKDMIETLNL